MARKKPLPAIDTLKALLSYDSETGKLFWRERPQSMFKKESECKRWNTRYKDKEALTASNVHGYKYGRINGGIYKAHRVAWALYYEVDPVGEMDHINGDRADNRIENLRLVTKSENCRNRKVRSDNVSGVHGVTFNRREKKWRAQITVEGSRVFIGSFTDIKDAIAARKAAEIEYDFHPGHGRK